MPILLDSITLRIPDELPQDAAERSSPTGKSDGERHILIYFIPGNPGLIEYYRPFLTYLSTALEPFTRSTGLGITIAGNSLANFYVVDGGASSTNPYPLNLQEMITWTAGSLSTTAADVGATETILIGHSVGAYIMMSLLHRQHSQPATPSPKITSTIGLFPTIIDLALSPNGLKATPLTHIPFLPRTLHLLARLLTLLLPITSLQTLIRRITHQPYRAATVTAAFLASPRGVQQAVHLAQHELREMREDAWGEEVWCADPPSFPAEEKGRGRTLFFYFGQADHWVADATRGAIIAKRGVGGGDGRVRMEVDGNGVPHDFCVREQGSRVVAERVARYLLEDVLGTR